MVKLLAVAWQRLVVNITDSAVVKYLLDDRRFAQVPDALWSVFVHWFDGVTRACNICLKSLQGHERLLTAENRRL